MAPYLLAADGTRVSWAQKKKRPVRLQTMQDRYVLVEMGLRAPLTLLTSLAGIGLLILARCECGWRSWGWAGRGRVCDLL